ncbi:MAG: hypothetical protein NUW22_12540 [Acidobacteria bacterium]|nr:hypothetical protein [Acidobacteriota bacterium]
MPLTESFRLVDGKIVPGYSYVRDTQLRKAFYDVTRVMSGRMESGDWPPQEQEENVDCGHAAASGPARKD